MGLDAVPPALRRVPAIPMHLPSVGGGPVPAGQPCGPLDPPRSPFPELGAQGRQAAPGPEGQQTGRGPGRSGAAVLAQALSNSDTLAGLRFSRLQYW